MCVFRNTTDITIPAGKCFKYRLCLQKLRMIFERKAQPPKIRKKTRIPRRAKERRLQDKRMTSEKKAARKKVD